MKTIPLHFWHNGDGSVGLDGDRATVNLNVDGFDALDEPDYVERAKEILSQAFANLWGCRVYTATESRITASGSTNGD